MTPDRRRPTARALVLVLALLAMIGGPALIAGPAGAAELTWSTKLADVPGAAELASGGKGVTIAVLDTWVEARHPDFGGRVKQGATCVKGSCKPGSDVPDVCTPHGTHVAGIAAGQRFGVAPEATVLPVRVLTDHSGQCTAESKDVANGVGWAASHGAQVINISLGSTYPLKQSSDELSQAVAAAAAKGIVVVVAAGNGQASGSDVYGASALVVAALAPDGSVAGYSQRGPGVDLAAPGGDPGKPGSPCNPDACVVSDWSDGGYAADAGTSMAAPYVAGAAALLLAQDPKRGRDDVDATLTATAKRMGGDVGAGRLDVLAAVQKRTRSTGSGTDAGSSGSGGQVAPPVTTKTVTHAPKPPVRSVVPRNGPSTIAADPASSNSTPGWAIPAVIAALLIVGAATLLAMTLQGRRRAR